MNDHLLKAAIGTADATSIGVTVAALLSWLPHVSAALSIVWLLLRIYQAATGRPLFGRCRRDED